MNNLLNYKGGEIMETKNRHHPKEENKITKKDLLTYYFELKEQINRINKALILSKEELPEYYEKLRKIDDMNDKKRSFIGFKKAIHPLIYSAIVLTRLSRNQNLIIINKEQWKNYNKTPIIYTFTHVGRYDVEIITETIKKSYCLIAGDPESMYRTSDGFAMVLNGVEYVNTDSKTDRKVCFNNMVRNLKQGMSIVLAPEGIWNASKLLKNSCKPCLDIYAGAVDAAFITECDIAPIGLEQYNNQFITYIGEPLSIKAYKYGYESQEQAKKAATIELRDRLATAKWNVWEYKKELDGLAKRKDIPNNYWNDYVDTRISEWKDKEGNLYYNEDIIERRIYKRKDIIDEDEVFDFINNKLKIKENNSFILRSHYNKYEKNKR